MALITWSDSLSVGVDEFDGHHKHLVDMANTLHDAMREGKSQDHLTEMIVGLKKYTQEHFLAEEKYMEQFKYPGFLAHRKEHQRFVKQVQDLENALKTGKAVITIEVMSFLRDWLANHIQISDKKYGPIFNEHGLH